MFFKMGCEADRFDEKEHSFMDLLKHGIFYFFYGFVKYLPSPIGDWLRYFVVKFFIKDMEKEE